VSACQPCRCACQHPAGLIPIGKLVDDNAIGTKGTTLTILDVIVAAKANG
jgi:ribonucleoside-diphosphate reductase alpha chain